MADKKTLDVVLEKVGNQPLKTTKVLMETKAKSPVTTKKATEKKNATTKKYVLSLLTVATPFNDEFDTIFGKGK